MPPVPTTDAAHADRGRRVRRVSGDERERAILRTAERLLGERPLHAISVDDLARGAGISRPTFYFYFASKEAVLLTLLDRVVAETRATRRAALDGLHDAPARWRATIAAFHDTFRAHRAVTLAAADARAGNPEVRALWSRLMEGWVRETTAAIEAERARGAAPDGVPARDLATTLNQTNEQVLHATFAGVEPFVAEDRVVDALVAVWLGAIYGAAATASAPPPPAG
jgi:AcrR family transcriptional regulator